MRLRRLSAAPLTAALLAGSVLVGTPVASAGQNFAITVVPDEGRMTDSFTVTGSGACSGGTHVVTFTYTNLDGDPQTVTAEGNNQEDGSFTEQITVPETAQPEEPASVQATSSCSQGDSNTLVAFGGSTSSNTVAFSVLYWTGTLTISKNSGQPGETVTVSGIDCYGGDVIVLFTDGTTGEEVAVTLLPNHTFSGTYTLPNAPTGSYQFVAECPGSQFAPRAFQLNNNQPSPSPLPPAPPLPGPVDFTG